MQLEARMQAVLSNLTQGPQRAGPKYRRLCESVQREFRGQVLTTLQFGEAQGRRQRSTTFAFLAAQEAANGFDNAGTLYISVPERRPDDLEIGELPLLVYQHTLERLHMRLQADNMMAYHPEIASALAPLVSHYLVQAAWPELVASDGQYLIPSPSGLFYGRIEGRVLKIVTFIDETKLRDTQRFERQAMGHHLNNLCHKAGLEQRWDR